MLLRLVEGLGTDWAWTGPSTLALHTRELRSIEPEPALMLKLRASFELFGALLGRGGEALMTMPGGDALGPRPVDQHLAALRALGNTVYEQDGTFHGMRTQAVGGDFAFEFRTVGGTRNALLASVLGSGHVWLTNAALEPEVLDLIAFLNGLGARIAVIDDSTVAIAGVSRLRGGEHTVIPDRIEAGTFLFAAAATRGRITAERVRPDHLAAPLDVLARAGFSVNEIGPDAVEIDATGVAGKPVTVAASEWPGFPTDLHPPLAALLATVPGNSRIADLVFRQHRFTYTRLLSRFGAAVDHLSASNEALITGSTRLHGTLARATDVRTGAALAIAAGAAAGESVITGVEHIERGYEHFDRKLRALGMDIETFGAEGDIRPGTNASQALKSRWFRRPRQAAVLL